MNIGRAAERPEPSLEYARSARSNGSSAHQGRSSASGCESRIAFFPVGDARSPAPPQPTPFAADRRESGGLSTTSSRNIGRGSSCGARLAHMARCFGTRDRPMSGDRGELLWPAARYTGAEVRSLKDEPPAGPRYRHNVAGTAWRSCRCRPIVTFSHRRAQLGTGRDRDQRSSRAPVRGCRWRS